MGEINWRRIILVTFIAAQLAYPTLGLVTRATTGMWYRVWAWQMFS